MISSNSQLHDMADPLGGKRDPGFAMIVAFDFYDGPERGVALYSSGEGVRFSSLGDSRSRCFRAFELVAIDGQWWPQIQPLQKAAAIEPPRKVLLPEASETLTLLERDVLDASARGYYVGVGSPYLEWLSVSAVTDEQLNALRQLGCSLAAFRSAHQILKSSREDERRSLG